MTSPFILAAALHAVSAAAPLPPTPAEKAAARTITADEIRGQIRFLASDLLEGRGPATRGDELAEHYIAAQFESLGLKPGGPGGQWFQPFDIVGLEGHPDTLAFEKAGKRLELKYSNDFMLTAGHQETQAKVENAEIVFVGYGIVAPEYQWDDYKGADLRGKVLLMMNNDPEDDPNLFAGKTRLWYGRWDYKYLSAAKTGAAGAIIIHTTHSAGYPWQVVQTSWAGERFALPHSPGDPELAVQAWTTEDASKRIAALGGRDLDALRASAERRDFKPVPLGVTLSTAFPVKVGRKQTGNVIGILTGSDPTLSRQAVIYTAHHDHLGVNKGAKPGDDAIYNGAVDNASGVAAVLSVARAFTALPKPPRRTVIFVGVAAEEQGLLGSEYLAHHPPVPLDDLMADINIDGINIWGRTKDISMVGKGKSSLDSWVIGIAASQGRVVKPDTMPDRGFYYRADQFNFARVGVPGAYFHAGMDFIGRPEGWGKEQKEHWERTHYHQPSDQLDDSWDLSGAVEDIQLCFYLGSKLAQSDVVPEWNKGDEFAALRKKKTSLLPSR